MTYVVDVTIDSLSLYEFIFINFSCNLVRPDSTLASCDPVYVSVASHQYIHFAWPNLFRNEFGESIDASILLCI